MIIQPSIQFRQFAVIHFFGESHPFQCIAEFCPIEFPILKSSL